LFASIEPAGRLSPWRVELGATGWTGGERARCGPGRAIVAAHVVSAPGRPVIAVIAGLITAVLWAIGPLTSSRATARIGSSSTLALVSAIGLVATLPLVAMDRLPVASDAPDLVWVGIAGLGYGAGLGLLYAAYARGRVSIISPIAASEGVVAAIIAILTGEPATALLLVAFAVTATGIVLTTLDPRASRADLRVGGGGYVLLALAAAVAFGVGLYAAGRASETVPLGWVVVSGRLVGVLFVAIPLLLLRRLRFERSALPYVLVAAIAEVLGILAFAVGSRDSIAVTAVLSSQFVVIVALVSHRTGETLARRQWLGIGVAALGIGAVTLLRS
jgi:drug/metabolite transporter (DMT)-like permease